MKRILSLIFGFSLLFNVSQAQELSIEKQLVGIVGAISGTVKTETRELKAGDKIYIINILCLKYFFDHNGRLNCCFFVI